MEKKMLIVLVILAVVGTGAWYVSSKKQAAKMESEEKMETTTPTAATPESSASGTTGMMQAKEVDVEGSEFKFSPSTITLKKGEPVRLVFKNTGKMPHDFVVDELSLRTKRITNGETDTVEFTPDKAGTFEFYCSVGKHRQMGMKGMLTVE